MSHCDMKKHFKEPRIHLARIMSRVTHCITLYPLVAGQVCLARNLLLVSGLQCYKLHMFSAGQVSAGTGIDGFTSEMRISSNIFVEHTYCGFAKTVKLKVLINK